MHGIVCGHDSEYEDNLPVVATVPSSSAPTALASTVPSVSALTSLASTVPSVGLSTASRGLELILSSAFSTNDASDEQPSHNQFPITEDASSDFSISEPASEASIAFTPLDHAPSAFPLVPPPHVPLEGIADASEPKWEKETFYGDLSMLLHIVFRVFIMVILYIFLIDCMLRCTKTESTSLENTVPYANVMEFSSGGVIAARRTKAVMLKQKNCLTVNSN
jgi:hypothetical protein